VSLSISATGAATADCFSSSHQAKCQFVTAWLSHTVEREKNGILKHNWLSWSQYYDLVYLQFQRQRCRQSREELFYSKNAVCYFPRLNFLQLRHCTHDRWIGSWTRLDAVTSLRSSSLIYIIHK
jgi:hypothetical protein